MKPLSPGRPFREGERVAFFPVQVGPTSLWLSQDFAIIEHINQDAGTFTFHFEGEPDADPRSQGLENVVRVSSTYKLWRAAYEEALSRTGSGDEADHETAELRRRVVAEHPIHGLAAQSAEPSDPS